MQSQAFGKARIQNHFESKAMVKTTIKTVVQSQAMVETTMKSENSCAKLSNAKNNNNKQK